MDNISILDVAEIIIEESNGLGYLDFEKLWHENRNNIKTEKDIIYVLYQFAKSFHNTRNTNRRHKVEVKQAAKEIKKSDAEAVEAKANQLVKIQIEALVKNGSYCNPKTVNKYRDLVKELCDISGFSFAEAMRTKFPGYK